MLPSILLLDDEPEVLKALQRALRRDYHVHIFTDPQEALEFFKNSPTQLVISDMKMPNINGAEFLTEIVHINNRCKRVVLTGYADTELAKDAINKGQISAYVNKPWDNQELKNILSDLITELKQENKKLSIVKKLMVDNKRLSLDQAPKAPINESLKDERLNALNQQKKLKTVNNELLQLSANLIAMQTRDTSGHTFRIAQQCKAVAKRLGLSEVECKNIHLAALFYRVGIHILPPVLIARPWFQMSQQERYAFMKYPQASYDILRTTEILMPCAEVVLHLFERIEGSGTPHKLKGDDIPVGSRILAIAVYYDLLVLGEIKGKCISPHEAFIMIDKHLDTIFDAKIFSIYKDLLENPQPNEGIEVATCVSDLTPGMVLSQDVVTYEKNKLLSEGCVLTENNILGLTKHKERTKQVIIAYVKHQK